MSQFVSSGAICVCSCGTRPEFLRCICNGITIGKRTGAVITDNVPNVNLTTFGWCYMKYYRTASWYCTYSPVSTWIPMRNYVSIKHRPALLRDSILQCREGGIIKIVWPGQALTISRGH